MVNFDYIFQWKKHKGKSVREVLECDPQYILWAHNNTDLKFIDNVIKAAQERRNTNKSLDFAARYGSLQHYPMNMLGYQVGAMAAQCVGRLPRTGKSDVILMDVASCNLPIDTKKWDATRARISSLTQVMSKWTDEYKRCQNSHYDNDECEKPWMKEAVRQRDSKLVGFGGEDESDERWMNDFGCSSEAEWREKHTHIVDGERTFIDPADRHLL